MTSTDQREQSERGSWKWISYQDNKQGGTPYYGLQDEMSRCFYLLFLVRSSCALRKNCSSSHVPYSLMSVHLCLCILSAQKSPFFICSFDYSFTHKLVEFYFLSEHMLYATSSRKSSQRAALSVPQIPLARVT